MQYILENKIELFTAVLNSYFFSKTQRSLCLKWMYSFFKYLKQGAKV